MEDLNIQYAIEGILFAVGEPVKASKLAAVLDTDIETINEAVRILKYNYDTQQRGVMIIDIDEGYQLCSRPEYHSFIQEIIGDQRRQALSNAAMEALAIIAYKQPITRGQVEFVRGVNSDGAINRLLDRDLIEEVGRLDAPGRPILYGTTVNFLRCFGLNTTKDLPTIDFSELFKEYEQLEINTNEIEEKDSGEEKAESLQKESEENPDNNV
ncbi:MAG: SMC-Scp complex subunit ScpB [Clostridia bacterium]|nr:SMC-Scp complex subunit ScpB [Clostridia bacterium]